MNDALLKKWKTSKRGAMKIHSGHPWIYSNELTHSPKGIEPGEVIELYSDAGDYLGVGYGNPRSLIAFRCLSRSQWAVVQPAERLVEQRLSAAWDFRMSLGLESVSFRLCFSEADLLPGLIIDRYLLADGVGSVLVVQVLTAGMEKLFAQPLETLNGISFFKKETTAVVLRRDSKARENEGLPILDSEVLWNPLNLDLGSAVVKTQYCTLQTDLVDGQKTGLFLDQRDNISQINRFLKIQKGKEVRILDLFSYVGQWGKSISQMVLDQSGVPDVTLVDASKTALGVALKNVSEVASKVQTAKSDIMKDGIPLGLYDVVVCDPPRIIHSKRDLMSGIKGYVKVNGFAMKALKPGGLFVTCSCSSALNEDEFSKALDEASRKSGVQIKWVATGSQSSDHPILSGFPEGRYLKARIGFRA